MSSKANWNKKILKPNGVIDSQRFKQQNFNQTSSSFQFSQTNRNTYSHNYSTLFLFLFFKIFISFFLSFSFISFSLFSFFLFYFSQMHSNQQHKWGNIVLPNLNSTNINVNTPYFLGQDKNLNHKSLLRVQENK